MGLDMERSTHRIDIVMIHYPLSFAISRYYSLVCFTGFDWHIFSWECGEQSSQKNIINRIANWNINSNQFCFEHFRDGIKRQEIVWRVLDNTPILRKNLRVSENVILLESSSYQAWSVYCIVLSFCFIFNISSQTVVFPSKIGQDFTRTFLLSFSANVA